MSQYRIGEFSRITGLTVKALRHYQEEGLLIPRWIDEETGYRYYDEEACDQACTIRTLRELGLSLQEIRPLIQGSPTDDQMMASLKLRLQQVQERIAADRILERQLTDLLTSEEARRDRAARSSALLAEEPVIRESCTDTTVIALRFRGSYSQIGRTIQRLSRAAGRHAAGPPFSLYYDTDYRDDQADIEVCLPVRQSVNGAGLTLRQWPGREAMVCTHVGPYSELGRSYRRLIDAVAAQGLALEPPFREEYIKGPGVLFRGNPATYRTKISAGIASR